MSTYKNNKIKDTYFLVKSNKNILGNIKYFNEINYRFKSDYEFLSY